MLEARGDLWTFDADVYVVTTNGFVKTNGEAVMGRGCAKEAALRWPDFPSRLGSLLRSYGNRPFRFVFPSANGIPKMTVATMPVKPVSRDGKPGWACEAEPELIVASAKLLSEMATKFDWSNVIVPRPGCGNGRLRWVDVKPRLEEIWDDRFTVVTW